MESCNKLVLKSVVVNKIDVPHIIIQYLYLNIVLNVWDSHKRCESARCIHWSWLNFSGCTPNSFTYGHISVVLFER
jgi:hypothetical protein